MTFLIAIYYHITRKIYRLIKSFSLYNTKMDQFHKRGYSSVVEHSTADREVTGSNPVAPYDFYDFFILFELCFHLQNSAMGIFMSHPYFVFMLNPVNEFAESKAF